ncbi:fibroblast growth factor-binding protein 1-like [Neovison vison]|uniref:fibroblast growth factor-binding protein 1-like n=1 Tax=Neovison vison TaxID=452646 RepID=UPI001CF01000|nr:fibroblast growth factor-binding protein 1-like [Neogale vison]
MRIHNLTQLSFLLLAAQVFLVEGQKELVKWQSSIATKDQWIPLGKPQTVQRRQQEKHVVSGIIVTRDRATCYLNVTDHKEGTTLKVECTRFDHKFSCVFAGNPKSCISCFRSDIIYWRQIAQNLHWKNNICEDSKMVLRTRVCGWRFPESNLKLVYSSLIRDPNHANMEFNPWCPSFVKGDSDQSSKDVKHYYPKQQSQTIPPVPTKEIQLPETTPTMPIVNEETTTEHLVVEKNTTTQHTTIKEMTPEQTTPMEQLVMEEITTTQQTMIRETTLEQTTPTEQLVMEETTTTQQTTATETTPEQTTPTQSFYTKEVTTNIPVEI